MKWILFTLIALASFTQAFSQKPVPQLNHVAVYVQDLKKSTQFYQQVIGLDTLPEPFHDGKHTWFRMGSSQLHLISGASPTIHNKNSHLCFSIPSINNFIQNLDQHKVPYEDWSGKKGTITTRVDGVKQIYFQDPDGYWIEVNDDFRH